MTSYCLSLTLPTRSCTTPSEEYKGVHFFGYTPRALERARKERRKEIARELRAHDCPEAYITRRYKGGSLDWQWCKKRERHLNPFHDPDEGPLIEDVE